MLLILPLKTRSVLNLREHWAARARRTKAHRAATILALRCEDPSEWVTTNTSSVIVVTLVRYGRRLDDDNLRGALKAVRDGIAEWAGIDDGSPRWRWEYGQGKAGKLGERVEVWIRIE